ncbi:MAG: peptidylprolyl isomerase [Gammaproteobacteria bacterium]
MKRLLFALVPALVLASTAHSQTRELTTTGQLLDRVAATVSSEPGVQGVVLQSELDEQVGAIAERFKEAKQEIPPENVLRQQVLERLVLQELQMQRAQHSNLKVPDETLNGALQDIAQRNGIPLSRLPEVLSQQGIEYSSYREAMRKELTLALLRQREVIQRINVTPREVDQYLEKQKNAPEQSAEYNVSHILISVPQAATPAQLEDADNKAKDVYKRASEGEDFAKLAIAYSNSQTALEGGALGWRKGSELPTFLSEVVAKLAPGKVSEPLRTPTGYHIVRLNETRGATGQSVVEQTHARHILMKPNELQDDATVRQKLSTLRDRIANHGEDFAGLAKVSSEDPTTASDGGDLDWFNPGNYPDIEAQLTNLKDNEITEPFRTRDGWHIVQLLGHRKFDNTDELKRRRAAEAIRESRLDEATELWTRRLRDEAYVEYKL